MSKTLQLRVNLLQYVIR